MPELVVIVPSRGRPHAVPELVAAFRETRETDVLLAFAVDESDPARPDYLAAVVAASVGDDDIAITTSPSTTMVEALNLAAMGSMALDSLHVPTAAIGFMGDDHRPRTKGWDRAYLDALAARPGIVYGNDLLQGQNLPTQCAMSTSWVRALGHMAPPPLHHLYCDDYWLTLGRMAGGITYLPDVVVEHVHPLTGKVGWDEGHRRVNDPKVYARDREAFAAYMAEHGGRDLAAVMAAGA